MSTNVQTDEQIVSDIDHIGDAFRQARKVRGLSQADLAKRVGMRQPAITRLENGHHVPTWRTLSKIADALEMTFTVSIVQSDALKNG